jgi:hypothetical protein
MTELGLGPLPHLRSDFEHPKNYEKKNHKLSVLSIHFGFVFFYFRIETRDFGLPAKNYNPWVWYNSSYL